MLTYEEALGRLNELQDLKYREFHGRLLNDPNIKLIGVRVPMLRTLAKEWRGEINTFLEFPNEYYEIVFLKCQLVALLPYEEFILRLNEVVPLIDNWATCDCFRAKCILKNKERFLPKILEYLKDGREFVVRYALTTLLWAYTEEKYFSLIFEETAKLGDTPYYVMMAAAWLIAEVIVKDFSAGIGFLKQNRLPRITHNKAIQKAIESFRLDTEEKNLLRSLKR